MKTKDFKYLESPLPQKQGAGVPTTGHAM